MPVTKSRLFWYLVAAICITSSLSNVNADEGSPEPLQTFSESAATDPSAEQQPLDAKTEASHANSILPSATQDTTTNPESSLTQEALSSPEGVVPQDSTLEANYVAPLNQPNANSVNTVLFPPNPNGFDPQQTHSPGMLSGLCTDVSVAQDATYCIKSPDICVGSGPAPISLNCPMAGDPAVMHCLPTLPSFQPRSGECRAPMNAKCVIVSGDTWGCAYDGYAPQGGYAMNQVPPPGLASMPMVNGYPVESSSTPSNPNAQTETSDSAENPPIAAQTNGEPASNPESSEATNPESKTKDTESSIAQGPSGSEENINKESFSGEANVQKTLGTSAESESKTKEEPTSADVESSNIDPKAATQPANSPPADLLKENEADKTGELPPSNTKNSGAIPTGSPDSKQESLDVTDPQKFSLESYHNNC
uniref:Uncharacterized protein AlNc14C463G11787 n=1 Tax=Albugo laibachii Nc14 TaxID=890382 RepID=F0X049_9STRA|nr:conserved hypothetical protein [Albugo laibachii Nc14]|eukprot:CCA27131.1 conserved hypothetical protein [Albugo laibachii Nc14]